MIAKKGAHEDLRSELGWSAKMANKSRHSLLWKPVKGRIMKDGAFQIDSIGHLVLKMGRLLLLSGADTEYARQRTDALVSHFGLTAELFISGERLILAIGSGASLHARIGHQINSMGVNSGRFDAVDAIISQVCSDQLDLEEASRRLDEAEHAPSLYPSWLVVLAVAGTTASLARLFGAAWPVFAAAFVGGILNIVLRRFLGSRRANPIGASFLIAFLSAVLAASVLCLNPAADPALSFVAVGMILVPGVPLINGISDMAGAHSGIGLARLFTGGITAIAIGFALFLAAYCVGKPLTTALPTYPIPIWQDVVFSAVAAFGFAMLFNAPVRAVVACVICGTISHGLRSELGTLGLELAAATLFCSFLAGLLSHAFGRLLALPWPTFAFPGTVAMIPGSYAFRAGVGGLQIMAGGRSTPISLIAETASLTISAIVLTSSVGVGLVLASALSRFLQGDKAK
ncbi:threonine/serine exporter family protein [Rhizobium calliandrae]|uniref:Threonine/serine exporter family protein n=1 Tax=Rhizobium calliandrae TaxID=1312182 RepID=A0ABT7KHW9_9HYPH|nr:threonine/serine exporter family protein [Rhizobium calliandrae]MDL2407777.1 threonine/serine exporter family protein [Rhizobium calliandrae]